MAEKNSDVSGGTETLESYEEKHLELLKSAAALFALQGYHNASIRDLSRVTGRSLSGLYYYFSGKEELLFQIQHHCYSTLLTKVREALPRAENPWDRLVTFVSHHVAFFRHNMDEMKVLAHEDVTLTGEYAERILDLKREYSGILVELVTACESTGAGSKLRRPDPEVAAFALFGAMNWLYTWPRRLRDLPAEELAGTIAQIFLCGFPGCSMAAQAGIRDNLLCPPQEFWKPGTPESGADS